MSAVLYTIRSSWRRTLVATAAISLAAVPTAGAAPPAPCTAALLVALRGRRPAPVHR